MGKQPVRVKTSTQLSVKLLDVAIGMMDTGQAGFGMMGRLAAKEDNNIDLFWWKLFSSFVHSAGHLWETGHVDLEVKQTHQLFHPP